MVKKITLQEVRQFWESNPLFTGESHFEPGSKEFFDEHRRIIIEDCMAGAINPEFFPEDPDGLILDLGCGPGFWSVEFSIHKGCRRIVAADLTFNGLSLARKRCEVYGVRVPLIQANAEKLPFASNTFRHVSCLGVIHHTPNTDDCVKEIARVTQPGGCAVLAVYYENLILRHWPRLRRLGKWLTRLGGGMPGRGREKIFDAGDANDIVRLYDGAENPLGKAYSRSQFVNMVKPYFEIEKLFFHMFPARALPFPVPKSLHRLLNRFLPFMINVRLRKPTA